MDADMEKWFKDQAKLCVEDIENQLGAIKAIMAKSDGLPPRITSDTIFPSLVRLVSLAVELEARWDEGNNRSS